MTARTSSELWMIRTVQNQVAGPYVVDQVRQMIDEKLLGHQDEVCPANGYWFYLHEREEVKKWLGVDPLGPPVETDEITETDTEIVEDEPPAPLPEPELAESPVVREDETYVSNRAFRQLPSRRSLQSPLQSTANSTTKIEAIGESGVPELSSSMIGWIILAVLFVGGFVTYLILK